MDHGADVNKKTKVILANISCILIMQDLFTLFMQIGWSPLRFAAANKHTKTGEILLERKADVYSLDHEVRQLYTAITTLKGRILSTPFCFYSYSKLLLYIYIEHVLTCDSINCDML